MKSFLLLLSCFAVCLLFSACSEDEATAPTAKTASQFSWQENGGASTTADSAYWTTWSTGTGIRAYKGGMQNYFEINWASGNNTSAGSKALKTGIGDFTFLKGSASYDIASDQSLTITAFNNNTLSGSFTFTVSGGPTITTIQAAFTDLPKK